MSNCCEICSDMNKEERRLNENRKAIRVLIREVVAKIGTAPPVKKVAKKSA